MFVFRKKKNDNKLFCTAQNYYRHTVLHRPVSHRVSLSVGHIFVEGEGSTPQAAR